MNFSSTECSSFCKIIEFLSIVEVQRQHNHKIFNKTMLIHRREVLKRDMISLFNNRREPKLEARKKAEIFPRKCSAGSRIGDVSTASIQQCSSTVNEQPLQKAAKWAPKAFHCTKIIQTFNQPIQLSNFPLKISSVGMKYNIERIGEF